MKFNFIDNHLLIVFVALSVLLTGCPTKVEKNKLYYSDTEIIGTENKKSDQINIDIFIDATTSMEGFAVNTTSKYSQFLDQLDASGNAWKKADVKYFKFGQIIKPIDRNQFLTAKNNLQFYRDPDVKKETYIDSVVKNTDSKRLSVLITDLFQKEGDATAMVLKIKDKCFANNIAVGILGIKTDFKGMVFDVPGKLPYQLTTDATNERPFYAIVFGNNENLESLFDALSTKPYVNKDQIFIISKFLVKSFKVSLTKTRESKYVNKITASADIHNLFDFSMKKDGKEARFDLVLDITRRNRAADFNETNLEIITFKKSSKDAQSGNKDSTLTNDISIENIKRNGNKLTATLVLNNNDEPGSYSYIVYLKANELLGLQTPKWIKDFSTEDPVPGTASASLTFNLDKFASRLLLANASISPSYISKIYINIFKR